MAADFLLAQLSLLLIPLGVVAPAWPLWQRRAEDRGRGLALTFAALIGGITACGSAVAIGWAFGLPVDVLRSLAPKSVTTPMAMGIAGFPVARVNYWRRAPLDHHRHAQAVLARGRFSPRTGWA